MVPGEKIGSVHAIAWERVSGGVRVDEYTIQNDGFDTAVSGAVVLGG